ncbi:hypothetical protein [Maricaulis sp.]|uniref:hypothetical protein n=1 Tax=Maricaulis sp. TaxID=1486257 RepID=UPI003A92F337
MPNIRRVVELGDYIFMISGKRPIVQQYIVGGFRVAEKISAQLAFNRFPENRLRMDGDRLLGNIAVDANGNKHPLDTHSNDGFARRAQNYIIGDRPAFVSAPRAVERARAQSLQALSEVMRKPIANRAIDMIGRHSKLDDRQVGEMLAWIDRWNAQP